MSVQVLASDDSRFENCMLFCTGIVTQNNNNNNRFTTLCPGLPELALSDTRRNILPPTILIIIQSLSASSIYYDS